MGSEESPRAGAFVGQLADHARALQDEARAAIAAGDYARAAALIGDAEMLAEDVHGLVDDIEHRATDRMLRQAAQDWTKAEPQRSTWPFPPRHLRAAIGASLVISLALVEC